MKQIHQSNVTDIIALKKNQIILSFLYHITDQNQDFQKMENFKSTLLSSLLQYNTNDNLYIPFIKLDNNQMYFYHSNLKHWTIAYNNHQWASIFTSLTNDITHDLVINKSSSSSNHQVNTVLINQLANLNKYDQRMYSLSSLEQDLYICQHVQHYQQYQQILMIYITTLLKWCESDQILIWRIQHMIEKHIQIYETNDKTFFNNQIDVKQLIYNLLKRLKIIKIICYNVYILNISNVWQPS